MGLAYHAGKFVASHPIGFAVAALLLGAAAFWPAPAPKPAAPTPSAPTPTVATAPSPGLADTIAANCARDLPALQTKATAELKAKNPDAAFDTLRLCAQHLGEGPAKATYVAALQQSLANNAAAAKKARAIELAQKKRQGVSLGMTQQDVLDSSWGKPRKINRSTYTFGVREQWVYDGGYLYFKDGILDSVQN